MSISIREFIVPEIEAIFKIPNIYFANDFGHTAGTFVNTSREKIKQQLFDIARRLAKLTKLLHIGYIIPPYNDTDYNGYLGLPEFKTSAAVPNYSEMLHLLKIFKNRDDVCALVEPENDLPGNYQILNKLVQEIS